MQYTLRYRSSRSDVWRWYWRSWRAKLWRRHLLLAVIVAFFLSAPGWGKVNLASWGLWFLATQPVVTMLFAAMPQIMFKPAERTLHVDPAGWSTQIGSTSGSRTWAEVASITEDCGSVVITGTNGNALIIPSDAFAGTPSREQFMVDVRKWHGA